MYRNKEFVFVHFQKTAGTHVKKLLLEIFGEAEVSSKWHGTLNKEDADKFVFCGIRNPWDFYVSLFHHSKENISPPILYFQSKPGLYLQTYGNEDSIAGFRNWLEIILSGEFIDRNSMILPTRFLGSPGRKPILIHKLDRLINVKPWCEVGLMSRFLIRVVVPGYRYMKIKDATEYKEIFEQKGLVDRFYRVENLTSDIEDLLAQHLSPPAQWREIMANWATKKSNTSNRDSDYRRYYTDELAELLYAKDRYIIDRFGYTF